MQDDLAFIFQDKNGELAMGVGFSIFAVSFIACLGAATESRIVQIIYIVLISILLVVCLACGIMLVTIVNTEAVCRVIRPVVCQI